MKRSMRWRLPIIVAVGGLLLSAISVSASTPGTDVRLTHDEAGGGYMSAYTLATGIPYSDATLDECSGSHGRANEPAVARDPRNTSVLMRGSTGDCGAS